MWHIYTHKRHVNLDTNMLIYFPKYKPGRYINKCSIIVSFIIKIIFIIS